MGKPAARQTDLTKKGGPIIQGSNTVLIGTSGGVACSACPGGVTEGNPVNPLLGAKVLPGEEDFALPGPLPFALTRSYSSHQSPQPAPVGLLGPGWWLPGEASLAHVPGESDSPGALRLHDGRGRCIAFEPLAPGEIAHSASEGLWLVRCGTGHLPGAAQGGHAARLAGLWNALPAAIRADARITVATASPLGPWWVFAPTSAGVAATAAVAATGSEGGGHRDALHGLCDRFGRVQRHERHADGPFAAHLRTVTDGAGRRYRFELERIAPATPSAPPAHGWGPDAGVRLMAVWLEADPHQPREALPLALVRYAYTMRGELARVIDHTGRTVRQFDYADAAYPGRMTGHAHAGRPMTHYTYDTLGRVVSQATPDGLDLHFDYTPLPADPAASPPQPERASTLVTDSMGRQRRYVFSGQAGLARVAERIEADGARFAWRHDSAGRLLERTDPLSRSVRHDIDAATGLVVGTTDAAGRTQRIAQAPRRLQAARRHVLFGVVERGQDGAGAGEKGAAFFGELDAARGTAQQRGFQLFLQPRQRPADARDGLAQMLGCGSDGAAVHHGSEGLQFLEGGFHARFSGGFIVDSGANIYGAWRCFSAKDKPADSGFSQQSAFAVALVDGAAQAFADRTAPVLPIPSHPRPHYFRRFP